MKYVYIENINKTNNTGIVDIETMQILCLCTKHASKLILDKFNLADSLTNTVSDLNAHISRLGAENEKLMEINARLRKAQASE